MTLNVFSLYGRDRFLLYSQGQQITQAILLDSLAVGPVEQPFLTRNRRAQCELVEHAVLCHTIDPFQRP